MTITNRHVGVLIVFLCYASAGYFGVPHAVDPSEGNAFLSIIGTLFIVVSLFILTAIIVANIMAVYAMIVGDLEFKIHIPLPFQAWRKRRKNRRLLQKKIDEIHEKIANTDDPKDIETFLELKEKILKKFS